MGRLRKVIELEPYLITDNEGYSLGGSITCYLDNGEEFHLYNVPTEIVIAMAKMKDSMSELYEPENFRDTVFGVLIMFIEKLRPLKDSITRVVIDGFNPEDLVYKASLYINVDGMSIRKSMIPSHAIFLALLFNKPIYVSEDILKIAKELEKDYDEESEDEESESEGKWGY